MTGYICRHKRAGLELAMRDGLHDNASHKVDDDAPKSDESDDESNSDKVRFLNRFIKLYW